MDIQSGQLPVEAGNDDEYHQNHQNHHHQDYHRPWHSHHLDHDHHHDVFAAQVQSGELPVEAENDYIVIKIMKNIIKVMRNIAALKGTIESRLEEMILSSKLGETS